MQIINISTFKSSLLSSEFQNIKTIEIEDNPMAEGGFGKIYSCVSINGKPLNNSQALKIFKDDGYGNDLKGFNTIQKLQDKIIAQNQTLKNQGKKSIEKVPALFALPQFSYKAMLNGKLIRGYSANKLNMNEFVEFEELLNERTLQLKYYNLSMNQKLQYALDLVEGIKILRDMTFIHADINGHNLFVNFANGHLVIIDFDSGAVTENQNDSPTTWGKPNEWLAPEIAKQLSNHNRGVQTVKINLFTDTWSVAVGIHYLIFLRHPLFYLNRLGIKDMKDYFNSWQWPNADKYSPNFNKSSTDSHNKIKNILINNNQLRNIYSRLSVTINEGFNTPTKRTTYYQWESTIRKAITITTKPRQIQKPQTHKFACPIPKLFSIAQLKQTLSKYRARQPFYEKTAFAIGFILAVSLNIQNILPIKLFIAILFLSPLVGFKLSKIFSHRWKTKLFLYYLTFNGITLLLYYFNLIYIANVILYSNFWIGVLLSITNIIFKVK